MDTSEVTALVLDQIAAYNARDIERFLAYYAPDATIIDGSGAVMAEGREAIRAVMGRVFGQNPELHAAIPQVMHVGEWVTIHSVVADWAMGDGTRGEMQWIEVFRVVDGKIQRLQLFH